MLNVDLDKIQYLFRVVSNGQRFWLFGTEHTVLDLTDGKRTYPYWYSAKCAVGHITLGGDVINLRFCADGNIIPTKSAEVVIEGKPDMRNLVSSVIDRIRNEYSIVGAYSLKTDDINRSENTEVQNSAI